jgi:hypothetical protein
MQADLQRWGIRIQYADRETYRRLREPDYWRQCVPDAGAQAVWLPEGGSDPAALHGVAQMVRELPFVPDTIVTAVGTGATLAGILAGMAGRGRVIGVAAFQGADYLHQEIARLLQAAGYPAYQNYQLLTDAHHGGFARMTPALIADAQCFVSETGIPLEPVYTGKLVSAVAALVRQGTIRAGECLLLLHTGGLQGLPRHTPRQWLARCAGLNCKLPRQAGIRTKNFSRAKSQSFSRVSGQKAPESRMHTGSGIKNVAVISIHPVLSMAVSTKLWRIVHRCLEKILEMQRRCRIFCAKTAHFS